MLEWCSLTEWYYFQHTLHLYIRNWRFRCARARDFHHHFQFQRPFTSEIYLTQKNRELAGYAIHSETANFRGTIAINLVTISHMSDSKRSDETEAQSRHIVQEVQTTNGIVSVVRTDQRGFGSWDFLKNHSTLIVSKWIEFDEVAIPIGKVLVQSKKCVNCSHVTYCLLLC